MFNELKDGSNVLMRYCKSLLSIIILIAGIFSSQVFALSISEEETGSTANSSPQANAGSDQTVTPGFSVTLDGSASYDPDGDTLTYSWQETTGSGTTISNSSEETAGLTAPSSAGSYIFKLYVRDGRGGLDSDEMTLTVKEEETAAATITSTPEESGSDFEGSGCSLHKKGDQFFKQL